jgi:hypothetical protein
VITVRVNITRGVSGMVIALASALSLSACSISVEHGGTARPPATYYVSPDGSDSASGTSPAAAWRTLARASAAVLLPGTRLLLQGGQRFAGSLQLGHKDAGRPAEPVVIGSYGRGKATIMSGQAPPITVYDTGGIQIQDLVLTAPAGYKVPEGINVYSNRPAGEREDMIAIKNVYATGFVDGITIGSAHQDAGFSNVEISGCDVSGNLDDGILTYGPSFSSGSPAYANRQVAISHVIADNNYGNPLDKVNNTGSGIVLGSVEDGSVTDSVAYDNGGNGGSVAGPAGIWTYNSTGVDIAHDLSYDNKTANRIDGDGFVLDQNVSDSFLEDDISYGNEGAGYLVYSKERNGAQRGDTVRDNISSDDVRGDGPQYGGITVFGLVQDAQIYQNTVVLNPLPGVPSPALAVGSEAHNVIVRNNIFAVQSGPIATINGSIAPNGFLLQGNDYYDFQGPWTIVSGGTAYYSLGAWRAATSEEVVDGHPVGLAVNPGLAGPLAGLSVKNPGSPAVARDFSLKPGSVLAGAGLDLASLGMSPAPVNFAGQPQSARHPDVGAE